MEKNYFKQRIMENMLLQDTIKAREHFQELSGILYIRTNICIRFKQIILFSTFSVFKILSIFFSLTTKYICGTYINILINSTYNVEFYSIIKNIGCLSFKETIDFVILGVPK